MTNFTPEFKAALGKSKLRFGKGRIVMAFLNRRPSKRKTEILQKCVDEYRRKAGYDPTYKIDWSEIDWSYWVGFFVKYILPFIVIFLGPKPKGKKR